MSQEKDKQLENNNESENLIFNVGDMIAGYRISEKIDEGGFGQVFKVTKDGSTYAMKIESSAQEGGSAIKLEMDVLFDLRVRKVPNFPILYDGGRRTKFHYIVMELLGDNIKALRYQCPNPDFLSPGTWSRISIQCLYVTKLLHDNGFVHRDIKPSNFALGTNDVIKCKMVYLFDFGLARRFVLKVSDASARKVKEPTGGNESNRGSSRDKKKVTVKKKASVNKNEEGERQLEQPIHLNYRFRIARAHTDFRGTMQYASPNAHAKIELGRADDLYSLMYMLIEMITVLPWTTTDQTAIEKVKSQSQLADLFKAGAEKTTMKKEMITSVTETFSKIDENLRNCNYYMTPDYEMIYQCFKEMMDKEGITWMDPYDWETSESPAYMRWKDERAKNKISHGWENPKDFFKKDNWATLTRPTLKKEASKDGKGLREDEKMSSEMRKQKKNAAAAGAAGTTTVASAPAMSMLGTVASTTTYDGTVAQEEQSSDGGKILKSGTSMTNASNTVIQTVSPNTPTTMLPPTATTSTTTANTVAAAPPPPPTVSMMPTAITPRRNQSVMVLCPGEKKKTSRKKPKPGTNNAGERSGGSIFKRFNTMFKSKDKQQVVSPVTSPLQNP